MGEVSDAWFDFVLRYAFLPGVYADRFELTQGVLLKLTKLVKS